MRHISRLKIMVFALAALAVAIAAGCASAPLGTEASTSGIRAAEEVGAASVPKASLHLQLAKEELEQARVLAAKGDDKKAESMLIRAEADAELAIALSNEDAERAEATAAIERVRKLRNGSR